MISAKQLIAHLGLKPLPVEGGWFRETWRGPASAGRRPAGTAIYYLLTPDTFSALHRLRTDEVYHFYLGDPVELVLLGNAGSHRVVLGPDVLGRQYVQYVVPAGVWQGSRLLPGGKFALLGTTMAPGFDFADFEPASRKELMAMFPAQAEIIRNLTRA